MPTRENALKAIPAYWSAHQFSIDRAKIAAMSSSVTGRGQEAGTTGPAKLVRTLKIKLNAVISGPCNHAQAEAVPARPDHAAPGQGR